MCKLLKKMQKRLDPDFSKWTKDEIWSYYDWKKKKSAREKGIVPPH